MIELLLSIAAALFFLSPGLIGLAVLIQTGQHPKNKKSVVLRGIFAAFLMWSQVGVLIWSVNFQSAFTGQSNYALSSGVGIFFLFCLVVYFVIAFVRLNNRQKGG